MAFPDRPRPRRWVPNIITLVGLALVFQACASSRVPARSPRAAPLPERLPTAGVLLGSEIRPARPDLLGGADYDLPVEANSWVEAELDFLLRDRRDVVHRWIERGDYYAEFVKEVFRAEGIPTDLYHLAMIESGFIPTAVSPAGAAGMWQFMPATSRDLSLRIDSEVDERLDPVRSTRAAARHLRDLYRIHGDWALAAAAYNAGSTRVRRSMEQYRARNFWELATRGDLAAETRHYVPRLYAMTIIGRNRSRFGLPPAPLASGFAFDSIHVDQPVSLAELARMTGLDEAQLTTLNPHLRAGRVPSGGYWVWVTDGTGVEAQRAYIAASQRRQQDLGTYTVRWGDTLSRIAQLTGVRAAMIREMNPDIDFDRLLAGSRIRLPTAAVEVLAGRSASNEGSSGDGSVAASRPSLSVSVPTRETTGDLTHTVEPGETLSSIARRYEVSVQRIREENSLEGDLIRSGQRLRIPRAVEEPRVEHVVEPGETLSSIARRYEVSVQRIREENSIEGDLIRPGQKLSIPGSAREQKVEHVVEAGDTLWEIAQRYGSSVEAIRTANELGERPIRPGQRLSVPTTRR